MNKPGSHVSLGYRGHPHRPLLRPHPIPLVREDASAHVHYIAQFDLGRGETPLAQPHARRSSHPIIRARANRPHPFVLDNQGQERLPHEPSPATMHAEEFRTMPMSPKHPRRPKHDASYKKISAHQRTVSDLLLGFAGNLARHLDFSTLERLPASFVTERLGQRHADNALGRSGQETTIGSTC